MKSVAEMMIEGRKAKNFSQEDVAAKVVCALATISRAEQGRGIPNRNNLKRIAAVLEIAEEQLLAAAERDEQKRESKVASSAGPAPMKIVDALIADIPADARAKHARNIKALKAIITANNLITTGAASPVDPRKKKKRGS